MKRFDRLADLHRQCDETRPGCGSCARTKAQCRYAYEAGISAQHGQVSALRRDLSRAQTDLQSQIEQTQALQKNLRDAQAMIENQRHEAETSTLSQMDVQDSLLDAQQDLDKLASLVDSLRSHNNPSADTLLKLLRNGEYDWALMEALDATRRDSQSDEVYPWHWHDWLAADAPRAKGSVPSSANSLAEQSTKARSYFDGACSPKSNCQNWSWKHFAGNLPSPPAELCDPLEPTNRSPIARRPDTEAVEPPTKKRSLDRDTSPPTRLPMPSIASSLQSMSIEHILTPEPSDRELPWPVPSRSPPALLDFGSKVLHGAVQMDYSPNVSHPEFYAAAFAPPHV